MYWEIPPGASQQQVDSWQEAKDAFNRDLKSLQIGGQQLRNWVHARKQGLESQREAMFGYMRNPAGR